MSHAPLMPVSRLGLVWRTVTAVKKVYITSSHSPMPSSQSSVAPVASSATITS
jgi:hypothetical protein